MHGDAGRVILDFAGDNELKRVHALDGVRVTQTAVGDSNPTEGKAGNSPQEFRLTAPAIDFDVVQGNILRHAQTAGAAQITITQLPQAAGSPQTSKAERTVITAGKFDAEFAVAEGHNQITSVHGAPDARIVSSSDGQPERVSTSESVDAAFLPQGGIQSVTQKGNVVYSDSQAPDKKMQAWADLARYSPLDQMLVLTGSPRVANGGMQTTANSIRINRATGDALAEGDVKSTYSELQEQPTGALLASSSPIHVTSHSMTAHNNTGVALYTGKARLWQDANVIEAPSIQFDRDRRSVTAQGTPTSPVQTFLVQAEKPEAAKTEPKPSKKSSSPAESSPISITGLKLTYADSERRAHYEGGVVAKGSLFTASAKTLDAYLMPHGQSTKGQSLAGPGQLDHLVAESGVVIQQPKRKAEGEKLVYTTADDKFVLTGGPPSIFDAEQGKITGVSLTFFRRDDRVLVEGEASTPVVTTTRVAQ